MEISQKNKDLVVHSNHIIIHLGLHKTGSTYLQRVVFPENAAALGFFSVRRKNQLSDFGKYLLRENDISYSKEKAFSLLSKNKLFEISDTLRLLLSEEQFAGSPWNSAKDRKRNFDRLHQLFPNAKYILVLRDQEELTQSLYLEYIKKGGTAYWKDFLNYKGNELDFSRGFYLQYAEYYNYITSIVGEERLKILYYKELQQQPKEFFRKMEDFVGKPIVVTDANEIRNPSIEGSNAWILRFFNRFLSSDRQPFLLLPKSWWHLLQRLLMKRKTSRKFIIPEEAVAAFCEPYKKRNLQLPDSELLKEPAYNRKKNPKSNP